MKKTEDELFEKLERDINVLFEDWALKLIRKAQCSDDTEFFKKMGKAIKKLCERLKGKDT